MDPYLPVNCSFHDQLEAFATLRQICRIAYLNANDHVIEVSDQIIDIYSANKAEHLKLKDGTEIRLDRIVTVNGYPTSYYS